MKITNRTRHDTKTLRAILVRVHQQMARTEGRLRYWKVYRVDVRFARCGDVTGCAALGGSWMTARLPKKVSPERVAWLFAHELLHSYGHQHRTPGSVPAFNAQAQRFVDEIKADLPATIPARKAKAKAPRPGNSDKLARVRDGIKRWQSKAKRAANALRKLRSKERYYLRREKLAASTPAASEGE